MIFSITDHCVHSLEKKETYFALQIVFNGNRGQIYFQYEQNNHLKNAKNDIGAGAKNGCTYVYLGVCT